MKIKNNILVFQNKKYGNKNNYRLCLFAVQIKDYVPFYH